MGRKRITERVAAPLRGVVVDRDAGTIDNVLVCGFSSENGRSYSADVLRKAVSRYEGKVVNCDHGKEATIDRRLGWLTNVRPGADGRPRATFNVLKTHPMADRVFEAAERNPSLFGLSHVAFCQSKMVRGVEVIESIEEVESVDLVANPATTKGLHESKNMPTTLKKWLESSAPRMSYKQLLKMKRFAEMDDYGEMPMSEPIAEEPIENGISAAFKTAIMSVVDDAMTGGTDPKEALGKIKKLLNAHGDINGDGKVDAADVDAAMDDDSDDEGVLESKRKNKSGNRILEALSVAGSINFRADATELETIAAAPKEKRLEVAKRLKESTRGAERASTTSRFTESRTEQTPADKTQFTWQS